MRAAAADSGIAPYFAIKSKAVDDAGQMSLSRRGSGIGNRCRIPVVLHSEMYHERFEADPFKW